MKEIFNDNIKKTISYHKKIRQIDDKFRSILSNDEKLSSQKNFRESNKLKKRESDTESIKEISKDALNLLQQKSSYLSKAFEINEIKEREEEIKIKREKFTKKGFVANLLLNEKNDSYNANEKLALSRKKTRLEQYIHTQYLFNCQVQALLAMTTILTSILEYENTVVSVGKEKVIHTFQPYNYEADYYNFDEVYYNKLGRFSKTCSYISFTLSIFLWISIYYDKILFYILLKGYREKSYKIINFYIYLFLKYIRYIKKF